MTQLATVKLMLAVSGLIVWGYGLRTDAPVVQYVGIGLLVAAVLTRFLRARDDTR